MDHDGFEYFSTKPLKYMMKNTRPVSVTTSALLDNKRKQLQSKKDSQGRKI